MDGPCRILSGDLRGGGGPGVCLWLRFSEPDPSHTLEERVVHWYFSQLDSNSSSDINKREMKPFKRYVKKKAKPKKCARRFTDYCDLNKDKVISLPELKGCLGVSKEGECSLPCSRPSRTWPTQAQGPRAPPIEGVPGAPVFSYLLRVCYALCYLPGAAKELPDTILVLPQSTKEVDMKVFTDIVLSAMRVC